MTAVGHREPRERRRPYAPRRQSRSSPHGATRWPRREPDRAFAEVRMSAAVARTRSYRATRPGDSEHRDVRRACRGPRVVVPQVRRPSQRPRKRQWSAEPRGGRRKPVSLCRHRLAGVAVISAAAARDLQKRAPRRRSPRHNPITPKCTRGTQRASASLSVAPPTPRRRPRGRPSVPCRSIVLPW